MDVALVRRTVDTGLTDEEDPVTDSRHFSTHYLLSSKQRRLSRKTNVHLTLISSESRFNLGLNSLTHMHV